MKKMIFVCATRKNYNDFFDLTLFGNWVKKIGLDKIHLLVYPENTHGLSSIYNDAILKTEGYDIINFIHDDVFILDLYWDVLISDYHSSFDILGVAGNRNITPTQPAWCVRSINLDWDDPSNLSGRILHGVSLDESRFTNFGSHVGELKIIDGVFISLKRQDFLNNSIKFDEQFKFNMYDTDFCRQIGNTHLKIGFCPLSLLHKSPGLVTDSYYRDYQLYIKKWNDSVDEE